MLIVSWNVAGLSTTVKRIHNHYGYKSDKKQPPDTKPAAKNTASLSPLASFFLDRHEATIVCLQEHKIPRQQLEHRHEPEQCASSMGVAGYESFWACDTRPGKGLNGVVTYAPAGSVVAANACPLGETDLDEQGRCVLTDHGTFCLFNVYVPAMGGQPLQYKMRFLQALRRAMQEQRQQGKPCILVGDLNITASADDVHWSDRVVHVQDVLNQVSAVQRQAGENGTAKLPQWKRDIAQHWSRVEAALETAEAVETKTTNSLTGEQYDKFRLAVTDPNNAQRRIYLGSHEVSPDYCRYFYELSAAYYYENNDEEAEPVLAREANVVRIRVLAELLSKIAGVTWDEAKQRSIVAELGAHAIPRVSPSRRWLRDVMEQDDMVDAFRHFYPTAKDRFTFWSQSTNERYVNYGKRIDYTLVDRSLLPLVEKGVESLRCGECTSTSRPATTGTHPTSTDRDPLSEAAAHQAATARGKFQPVSFQGGGITEAPQDALDSQFGPPHTGMIYTPPSFSDHIGISLLMKDSVLSADLTLKEKDAATRKAQPHKMQRSILSFLTQQQPGSKKKKDDGSTNDERKAVTETKPTASSKLKRPFFSAQTKTGTKASQATSKKRAKKPPAAKKVPKKNSVNSILHHFRPKDES